jgi:hypothetical protein
VPIPGAVFALAPAAVRTSVFAPLTIVIVAPVADLAVNAPLSTAATGVVDPATLVLYTMKSGCGAVQLDPVMSNENFAGKFPAPTVPRLPRYTLQSPFRRFGSEGLPVSPFALPFFRAFRRIHCCTYLGFAESLNESRRE